MKGWGSIRLLRARLYLDRHLERNHWWFLPLREGARLVQRLQRHRAARAGRSGKDDLNVWRPCPIPFREMVINCDGTIACGSTAKAPLLDAYERQGGARLLSNIWNGTAFQQMRGRVLTGDTSGCGTCNLHQNPGFRALSEEERRQGVIQDGSLRQLLIEPTAQCNLDCPTVCGQSYPRRRQPAFQRTTRFMPLDLFRTIIEGIDFPLERICLYNYGEPLLHPDLFTMCRLLRKQCPSTPIILSTNGTRLAEAEIRAGLLHSDIDELVVSVDGASQSTYEAYRRGGKLASILDGMRLLRSERNASGLSRPRIVWRYILFSWNDSEEELELARQLAHDCGVDQFCFHLSDIPELASRIYRPGTKAFEGIRTEIY